MADRNNRQIVNDAPESSSRRRVIAGGLAGIVAVGMAGPPVTGASSATLSRSGKPFSAAHELRPLPFKPSRLRGLSKRLIESHWSNNYGGSVRALNTINQRLAYAMDDHQLQAFVYNDLKREHLMRTGSVVLHELYFDNLGGTGRPGSSTRSTIARAFGSFDRWEREFRRIAAGLGGGSGWVVLGYNRHLRALENYWMADHMHCPAATEPLLVLDMYEHSYHMDYGAATARYVDAFFDNIDWDRVDERIDALG